MNERDIVAESPNSTVVAEYVPSERRASSYQSEADLEKALIKQLQAQAYEYLPITDEAALISNLRVQLEKLNGYEFTDTEWKRFFSEKIASSSEGIEEKTAKIQEDYVQLLERDSGEMKNIYLIDKKDIHNNSLQVINQYKTDQGTYDNRYDVTLLVNGLPLVHIELKRRGVAIKEAFNQVNRYQRDSFWASSGLFEYVQIFIISNGTHAKYYSNTTRDRHIKEDSDSGNNGKKTSNSFEFTSWWADAANRQIPDLMDFAATFLSKHSLLNILTKYCIFTTDRSLMVMRPYQIVATERILNRIEVSTNYRQRGTVKAGGYIWHTTGSGKTLTSFKTARLASRLDYIDKVLFVVDRKDLDYQTMKEYDKFEKGAANSNTSTAKLKRQLEDPNARIIITTIQKLDKFIKKNEGHKVFSDHIVIIFDECHRSQFGDMHRAITKNFKNYHLFGFTGTPIFPENVSSSGRADLKTTEQAFGDRLHTYTIVNAISDKNVLPFHIDYVNTIRKAENVSDEEVSAIDTEAALSAPERVENIVEYILGHFDQKTKRDGESYIYATLRDIDKVASAKDRSSIIETKQSMHLRGFNSIFAVSSIEMAKRYYAEFKRLQADRPASSRLKVALIYSFGANEEEVDGIEEENSESTSGLDKVSRDFLEDAIHDYNALFSTSYSTDGEAFQNYYKDVSLRMKNREIDLLIVVNMFLTGFDATTLNTLWVDKNLKQHGLLQAFSRTNRILNSVKTFGNIVTFRDLEKATNEALALFGDEDAGGIVLLRPYADYYEGYDENGKHTKGYAELVAELVARFPLGQPIVGEQAKKDFIRLYGTILRLANILSTFDEFEGNEILDARDSQDYRSVYIDLHDEFRKEDKAGKANINDDVVFEMELIKQVDIDIDYILNLVRQYHDGHLEDKELLVDISKAIESSMSLRNKKDLIERFIATLNVESDVDAEWRSFVNEQRADELEQIIEEEELDREETYKYVGNAFRDGSLRTSGTALTKVLPPASRFSADNARGRKREKVLNRLTAFFERFFDISRGEMRDER